MPYRAKRPCRYPGCRALVESGWCEAHQPKRDHSTYDSQRGSSNARGYNVRWQKARVTYLRSHPLCAECERQGRTTPATLVDHIIPHKGDTNLFWDVDGNWQPLCKPCHDRKTAREDGGFGRPCAHEGDSGDL
jgi:5-methylcytosine-specific restriction protein A